MARPKGFERGSFGGSSNPLEDRHLKVSAEGGKIRAILISNNELESLRKNNGKGTLKKHLYGQPLSIGETISLESEQGTVQAKVTAIPAGLAVGKNKSTVIEVAIIIPSEK